MQQSSSNNDGSQNATNGSPIIASPAPQPPASELLKPTVSSLPLEMLIFFSYHYSPFFFTLNICLFTYKSIRFYYPSNFLGWELSTIFLYLFIDYVRLTSASKGNKTGMLKPFIQSLILSMPIIVLHAYYISSQTYVLRIDIVINSIAFLLLGFQIVLSVVAILNIILSSRRF